MKTTHEKVKWRKGKRERDMETEKKTFKDSEGGRRIRRKGRIPREREREREGKRGKSKGEEERGLKTFSRELCIELSLTLVAPQEFTAVGVDSIFQPASLRQVHVICHPPYSGHI